MTKKDYVLIARGIHRAAQADTTPARVWAIETAAVCIANELQADNPRFDRARFIAACGVTQ